MSLNKVGFLTHGKERGYTWEPGSLSKGVLERTHRTGGGVMQADFALDWMLPESGNNSIIGYLNRFYLRGKNMRTRLKLCLV